jgi:acetyl-CoA carboxylase biotin carboxylase subunit
MKFKKVLIANRGEIAVRVLRTCRDMGIETVAVHSTADEDSLHVKLSDESVCIGPAKSSLSYLSMPTILTAAEISEADAIHPGFGFLSENKEFASMCKEWGFTFIGPSGDLIDKIYSKKIAKEAGIPILEPILVNGRDDKDIVSEVEKMGLPVLIKASAGGGGKGMKRIDNISELLSTIERLKTEAKAAFGDDTIFIEKYIVSPRHVEVQIVADQHGNVIHLGERDCTVQRRYQKIIEESPCPLLDDQTREAICKSAVQLAEFVKYDSVGTVEYIYDQDSKEFFFMEMNTRIQVEHPVTEARCGIDLVELQIRIAQGEGLPYVQSDIELKGHSLECRINAEDPETFAPSPGEITHYYRPSGFGIRVDDFIYSGYKVSPFYDSMLAKIIVYGKDRDECIRRMERAFGEILIGGVKTNIALHQDILSNRNFRGNNYSTSFLSEKLSKI